VSIIKSLTKRCKEIIKKCEDLLISGDSKKINDELIGISASIENIYRICFPNGIPDDLRTDNFENTLRNMGIIVHSINEIGRFKYRLNFFKNFAEDLEKGLVTRNLVKIITLDIYNDMIEQAQNLREFYIEPLNRAACVLTRIVLEDTLKKLCDDNSITLTSDKASVANDELKKKNIITKEQWRLNQVWLDIGNKAAHPESSQEEGFSSITEDQMNNMINSVKQFAQENL